LETLKNEIRRRERQTHGADRPSLTPDILVIGMDRTPRPSSAVPLGEEEELGGWEGI